MAPARFLTGPAADRPTSYIPSSDLWSFPPGGPRCQYSCRLASRQAGSLTSASGGDRFRLRGGWHRLPVPERRHRHDDIERQIDLPHFLRARGVRAGPTRRPHSGRVGGGPSPRQGGGPEAKTLGGSGGSGPAAAPRRQAQRLGDRQGARCIQGNDLQASASGEQGLVGLSVGAGPARTAQGRSTP